MPNRAFQSVITQMKDATKRSIGVADPDGIIVAAGDLALIGVNIAGLSGLFDISKSDPVTHDGKTFKLLGYDAPNDYSVFVEGTDELAKTVCNMAVIAINEAGVFYEENHDKRTFVKTIISENILPGDIPVRAKEFRFNPDVTRGVLVVRIDAASQLSALGLIQDAFPDKKDDYVFSVGDTNIVVVKEMPPESDTEFLVDLAKMINEKIMSQLGLDSVIGVGTPANHLRELAERYKQALIAIDIGRVFDADKTIINYDNLGISRLIYQLPTTLCEIFLSEVFKKNPIEVLDEEMLFTIDCFFENSLNVSETSRKLYVHRNTLVYRLDKIEKITGLDLREFDDAIVFKVALMVNQYLTSQKTSLKTAK